MRNLYQMNLGLTSPALVPYYYGIASNLAFGTAAIVFSKFARSHSAAWMNQLKVAVAIIGFALGFVLFEHWAPLTGQSSALLACSGFVGLCLGDLFLFKAFSTLGPTRTLILYTFQPFLLGIYGYFFLGQSLSLFQFLAILCMLGCVATFLLERNHHTGKWDLHSFLNAFLGIFFDAIGVMLSRTAFENTPDMGSFQANGVRAAGALIGFIILAPRAYPALFKDLKRMSHSNRNLVLSACFFGTFVSLSLYLHALKTAHVATLTSIAITGPVWVSIIEHIRDKELPNRFLVTAFILFLTGFALLAAG